jgi:hypothetical protein
MQLDSSRNHIIMVNLWLSMLNISVMAATIVPAFFGMNLHSGMSENDPLYFYLVRPRDGTAASRALISCAHFQLEIHLVQQHVVRWQLCVNTALVQQPGVSLCLMLCCAEGVMQRDTRHSASVVKGLAEGAHCS